MNRISVKQIKAAYREIGAAPTRESWGDRKRCCGLMACVLATGQSIDVPSGYEVARVLGLSFEYVGGFAMGFDGKEVGGNISPQCKTGLDDGRAAAQAIFG